MKSFLYIGFFLLAQIIYCSSRPLDELISMFDDMLKRYDLDKGYGFGDIPSRPGSFRVLAEAFSAKAKEMFESQSPLDTIQRFCHSNDLCVGFVLYFWNLYERECKEAEEIWKFVFLHTSSAWIRLYNSLLTFIESNLFELGEKDKILFAEAALKLFSKFKRACNRLMPGKKLLPQSRIDNHFRRIANNLALDFYEYQFPDDFFDGCFTIIDAYNNIVFKPKDFDYQIKFFFLIKQFLKRNPSHFDVLSWLVNQRSKFIKWFLLFNLQKTIDEEEFNKIIIDNFGSTNFYEAYHQVVRSTKEQMQELCPKFKGAEIAELQYLLDRFHEILTK
jgi:hypothetical protein